MYKEGFPSKLKHAREQWSFTQKYVEAELGIKQSVLSNYEAGRREPDIETLGKLADLYGVSLDWLFSTKGDDANRPRA